MHVDSCTPRPDNSPIRNGSVIRAVLRVTLLDRCRSAPAAGAYVFSWRKPNAALLSFSMHDRRARSYTLDHLGPADHRWHSRRRHRRFGRRAARRHRHAERAGVAGAPTTVTNEAGIYRFPNLAPGTYEITAELPGFTTSTQTGIQVALGGTAEVDVQLKLSTQSRNRHRDGAVAGRGCDHHAGGDQLLARVGRERAGAPVHLLRPDQRGARRERVDLHQFPVAVVRIGHQREPVSDRRHRLHRAADRRGVAVAEHRRDRRNPGALARRARRLRQPGRRGVQRRDAAGQQHLPRRRQFLLPEPEPHRPQHHRRAGRRPALSPRRVQGHDLCSSAGRS